MKKLLTLFIIFGSLSALAGDDYLNCMRGLRQDFDQSEELKETHALVTSRVFVGYAKYGSMSGELKKMAAFLGLGICTKVKYGLTGRTVSYTIEGKIDEIEEFQNTLIQYAESSKR